MDLSRGRDSPSSPTIQTIVELKKKNEELEKKITFLKMENFDYALKCNRIKNTLRNVHKIMGTTPGNMLDLSENISSIIKTCVVGENLSLLSVDQSLSKPPPPEVNPLEKPATANKAHVVNPHMVNGHILYTPTINLTRLPQTSSPQPRLNEISESFMEQSLSAGSLRPHSSEQAALFNSEEVGGAESVNVTTRHRSEDSLMEPSTSSANLNTSHSTVLSGTFQEVKIYLNPSDTSPRQLPSDDSQPSVDSLVSPITKRRRVQKGKSGRPTRKHGKQKSKRIS